MCLNPIVTPPHCLPLLVFQSVMSMSAMSTSAFPTWARVLRLRQLRNDVIKSSTRNFSLLRSPTVKPQSDQSMSLSMTYSQRTVINDSRLLRPRMMLEQNTVTRTMFVQTQNTPNPNSLKVMATAFGDSSTKFGEF